MSRKVEAPWEQCPGKILDIINQDPKCFPLNPKTLFVIKSTNGTQIPLNSLVIFLKS